MKRIYHDVRRWEEIKFNMWGCSPDRAGDLRRAIDFTSDHKLYGSYMLRVSREWKISCENALTDKLLNRRAWIGHAAVALALQIPEDITRKAWGFLTDEQRALANREAERAIREWEENQDASGGVPGALAQEVLFG